MKIKLGNNPLRENNGNQAKWNKYIMYKGKSLKVYIFVYEESLAA